MTDTPTIEIVSIDADKALDQTYQVAPDGVEHWGDAANKNEFATLGAILRNADGEAIKDQTMTISTDDDAQDKELVGTGNFWGAPYNVPYYPFQYLFKTAGEHTITFSALGVEESVTLKAE